MLSARSVSADISTRDGFGMVATVLMTPVANSYRCDYGRRCSDGVLVPLVCRGSSLAMSDCEFPRAKGIDGCCELMETRRLGLVALLRLGKVSQRLMISIKRQENSIERSEQSSPEKKRGGGGRGTRSFLGLSVGSSCTQFAKGRATNVNALKNEYCEPSRSGLDSISWRDNANNRLKSRPCELTRVICHPLSLTAARSMYSRELESRTTREGVNRVYMSLK